MRCGGCSPPLADVHASGNGAINVAQDKEEERRASGMFRNAFPRSAVFLFRT